MRFVFVGPVVWSLAFAALAGDGVIEINQAKAIAGGVTACDTPGFPVEICDSGSYRLTSDLKYVSAVSSAIVMTAADVTLDLNGMTILGDNTCTTAVVGWVDSCAETFGHNGVDGSVRTVVANGRVIGASRFGVALLDDSEVRDLVVSTNGLGIFLGPGSVATRVSAIGNLNVGVFCAGSCELSRVTAKNNGADGVFVSHSVITQSVAVRNRNVGFQLGVGSQLSHFSSFENGTNGVRGSGGALVSFGAVRDNNRSVAGGACGLQLIGGDGYHGVVVTALAGGNAATVCGGGGVNLGGNSCQGGPCPP